MNALSRSFRLFKVCLAVLSKDKELLVFPLLSGAALVVVLLSFVGIGIGAGSLDRATGSGFRPADLALLFTGYLAAYFVMIFFNSALVYAAYERLQGGDPTVRSGLRGAAKHLPNIFLWSLVSATVGLVLSALERALEERLGGIGAIIARVIVGLIGMAWSLATYFVVPLLVIEGKGPVQAVRGSAGLFRRTWGEQVTGNFGMGLATLVVFLLAGVVLFGLYVALGALGPAGFVLWVALAAVAVISILLVSSALSGIYNAALYRYAATGQVPELFPQDIIRDSYRHR